MKKTQIEKCETYIKATFIFDHNVFRNMYIYSNASSCILEKNIIKQTIERDAERGGGGEKHIDRQRE